MHGGFTIANCSFKRRLGPSKQETAKLEQYKSFPFLFWFDALFQYCVTISVKLLNKNSQELFLFTHFYISAEHQQTYLASTIKFKISRHFQQLR